MTRIISKEEAGEIALAEALRTMGSAESKGERVEIYRVTDQRPTGAYMSDQEPAWLRRVGRGRRVTPATPQRPYI